MSARELLKDLPIAFDLDGTLVDTAPDLVRALNASIAPHGLKPVPVADVRAMVGRGARALIAKAYEREGRALAEDVLQDRLDHFLAVYREAIAVESRAFEGVETVLDSLAGAGARLSVCTNKPQALAEALLDALKLAGRFERIVGPEGAPAKKPDPSHLLAAFGHEPAGASVLVGDSEPDVLAARGAGALSIVFEGGYSEKPARTLGADRLFTRFDELETVLLDALSHAGR
ncbi:HAD hydrolase-like protein [Marinicauda algicola]|nr:HAD hydrolase-like protein [Marinicauda algicola]